MRRHIYNIIKTTQPLTPDSFLSILAPHNCLGCGVSGSLVCKTCIELAVSPPPSRCFNCQSITENYKICGSCKRLIKVDSLVYAGAYDGIHKQAVLTMKKHASRTATKDIAMALALLCFELNHLQDVDFIVPVPTIQSHIRERSFDHTKCIAEELSKQTNIPCLSLLERTTNTRQVGKSRKERFEQMENGVKLKEVKSFNGVKILLLDDIATTGATLSACARELKKGGAKQVDAVVFASGN